MNKVIMMGRLTRDPNVRHASETEVASFSLAVDRQGRKNGEREADFFNCTAFGKQAEFVEKYLKQGTKVLISGRIQNDSYTNRDGEKVHTVQIILQEVEFCESKGQKSVAKEQDGFMNIPDGVDDEELPFA